MPPNRLQRSLRSTFLGLGINTVLAVVKMLAGIFGHSHALVADAVESMADVFSSLIVWRGVAIQVPLTARFRFRIEGGGLRIAYVLDRLEDVLDSAWAALLGEMTETLPVPVLAGQAPSYGG